jgi:hypothetical protein
MPLLHANARGHGLTPESGAQAPEMETNADTVKFAVADRREMKGWMRWVGLQLTEALLRQCSNFSE